MSREFLLVPLLRLVRIISFLVGATIIVVSGGFVWEMASNGTPWQALVAAIPMVAVGVKLCGSGLSGEGEFFETVHDEVAALTDYSRAYHGDDAASDPRIGTSSQERLQDAPPERLP